METSYTTPEGHTIKMVGLAYEPIPLNDELTRYWVRVTQKNKCTVCSGSFWGRFLVTLLPPTEHTPTGQLTCCWECLKKYGQEGGSGLFAKRPPLSAFQPMKPGQKAPQIKIPVGQHKPPNKVKFPFELKPEDQAKIDSSLYEPILLPGIYVTPGLCYVAIRASTDLCERGENCFSKKAGLKEAVILGRLRPISGKSFFLSQWNCWGCRQYLAVHGKGHKSPGLHEFMLKGDMAEPMPKLKEKQICLGCKDPICEVCQQCETASCKFVGKKITTKAQMASVRHLLAETQKARGYVALSESKIPIPRPFRIIENIEEVSVAIQDFSKMPKVFVRPCPIRPRHGFVESRPVDLKGDINAQFEQILMESKAADPQAELLILPLIEASYNMVITPTQMAIGPGHDGATAGKNSVMFPLMGEKFMEVEDKLYKRAAVDTEKEDPYFEAVIGPGSTVLFTQVRAGAKVPLKMGKDYIPKDMVVTKVIEASLDLLEWEKQMKLIEPGTAVYHLGGTLISHYGVHCMYNNVPMLTTRVPKVGEKLKAQVAMQWPDPRAVMRGLDAGIKIPMSSKQGAKGKITCQEGIRAMTVALHNAGAMAGEDGFWLGFGCSIMMRAGMAASHGEARHKDYAKKSLGRQYIYELALSDFFGARETLGHAQYLFKNASWGGGYGGKKWAQCTDAILDLDKAVRRFLTNPTDTEATGKMVSELNNAVNQAHNNGWWMNKFADKGVFDRCCKQSIMELALAAPVLHRVAGMSGETNATEQWSICKDIEIAQKGGIPIPKLKDGECGCPYCFENGQEMGKKWHIAMENMLHNYNGTKQLDESTEIVEAQAQILPLVGNESGTEPVPMGVHVQIKVKEHPKGYFSFDLKEKAAPVAQHVTAAKGGGQLTWSGSGKTNYIKLTATKVAGAVWQFVNDEYKVNFAFDLSTWNIPGAGAGPVNKGGEQSAYKVLLAGKVKQQLAEKQAKYAAKSDLSGAVSKAEEMLKELIEATEVKKKGQFVPLKGEGMPGIWKKVLIDGPSGESPSESEMKTPDYLGGGSIKGKVICKHCGYDSVASFGPKKGWYTFYANLSWDHTCSCGKGKLVVIGEEGSEVKLGPQPQADEVMVEVSCPPCDFHSGEYYPISKVEGWLKQYGMDGVSCVFCKKVYKFHTSDGKEVIINGTEAEKQTPQEPTKEEPPF